uniref:Uncharacterized protein n=1 Tax=Meloidogyne enterolobii TaxID=390850 RepID=A0A6V7VIM0_MELEN|nr:unnamed protein product [Meloidogyne enterolobii]
MMIPDPTRFPIHKSWNYFLCWLVSCKGNKEIKRPKREINFFKNLLDKPKNDENLPDFPSTLEKENNFGSEIYPPSNKFQKEENKIEPYPEPSDNFQ